jgi:hypothetical protein
MKENHQTEGRKRRDTCRANCDSIMENVKRDRAVLQWSKDWGEMGGRPGWHRYGQPEYC